MEHQIITNEELGTAYFYWELNGNRIFLAKQVLLELGYTGTLNTLYNYDLKEGVDILKFTKAVDRELFNELVHLKCIGSKSSTVMFLTESGFWKLVMQSKKSIGIKTRQWLSQDVLPSIRKKGYYEVAPDNPLSIFTERKVQIGLAKNTNAKIATYAKTPEEYSNFWNDMHLLVVGLNAKDIKNLYKSKSSAKEVLRQHLPHLEATECVIEDLWQKGVGLERIKDSGLHQDLANSFHKIISFGINVKDLGRSN